MRSDVNQLLQRHWARAAASLARNGRHVARHALHLSGAAIGPTAYCLDGVLSFCLASSLLHPAEASALHQQVHAQLLASVLFCLAMGLQQTSACEAQVANVCMNSLNAMWFYKMAKGALRVLTGSQHKKGTPREASGTELNER